MSATCTAEHLGFETCHLCGRFLPADHLRQVLLPLHMLHVQLELPDPLLQVAVLLLPLSSPLL